MYKRTHLLLHGRLYRLENLFIVSALLLPKPNASLGGSPLTSSSIFASAMSCSLPFPLATFCASCICELTACSLNSSIGYPSTAFMLRTELGWTTAKPPDTLSIISLFPFSLVQNQGRWRCRVIRKNCLFPPLSSMISTKPGFSCSIEGTCWARIPISPDSAGILTCTLATPLSAKAVDEMTRDTGRGDSGERTHLGRCRLTKGRSAC
jgi:hypothetical protein